MSSESSPTPQETNAPQRLRRSRRRNGPEHFLRFLPLVALVALGLGVSARPVYRQVKAWRARQEARAIERRVAQGQAPEVARRVRSALSLAPEEPTVLRATARFLAASGAPEAVSYWQRYLALAGTRATLLERQEFVAAALDGHRLDLSRPELAALLRTRPDDPELMALQVREHRLLHDTPSAIATARTLLSQDPRRRSHQLLLGATLLASPQPPESREGRLLLWGLVADPGEGDVTAATLLAPLPDLSRSEARTLLQRLPAGTNAPLETRLVRAAVQLRLGTEPATDVLDRVLAGLRAGDDGSVTATVAEWLAQQAPARLVEWLPESVAKAQAGTLVLRAEALARTGQWRALQTLLEHPPGTLSPALRHYLRGRLAAGVGRPGEAESEYRLAIETLGEDRRWLPLFARTAEVQGLASIALLAWERALEDPEWALEAAHQLRRQSPPSDDLTGRRRVIRRLASFFSADDSFAAESALLDLLFEEDLPRSITTLERVTARRPGEADWRAGLAWARVRQGQPAAGLQWLESTGFDFEQASPRAKAFYVATVGNAGQRELARRLARQVPTPKLHLQERRLVEPWL